MRPAEYPEEDIIAAGQQLQAESRRVTGFALRKVVGGGNPTRLINVWEQHEQQKRVVDSEPVQELPVEVEEALNGMTQGFLEQVRSLAQSLNSKAVQSAERRVSEVMKTANEQHDRAEAEVADAAETVEDLEERLKAREVELQAACRDRDSIREAHSVTLDRLNELQRTHAVQEEKLEGERQQRQGAEKKLNELQERVNDLKSDKAQLQADRQRAERSLEKVSAQLHDVQSERDNLIATRAELKQQLAVATEKYEHEHQRFVQRDQDLARAQGERDTAREAATTYQAKAEQANAQLEQLIARLDAPASSKGKKKPVER